VKHSREGNEEESLRCSQQGWQSYGRCRPQLQAHLQAQFQS
jgi:hypothetical protein